MPSYIAYLTGAEEIPPKRTPAYGTAQFRLSSDGTRLSFTLSVQNISRMTEAHIHLGRRGTNGPEVVFLVKPLCNGVTLANGVIRGAITQSDLVGPFAGRSLASLIHEMSAGRAYVNVHTVQNPLGEIRGQLRYTP